METKLKTEFVKDLPNKKVTVKRNLMQHPIWYGGLGLKANYWRNGGHQNPGLQKQNL